MHPRRLTLPLLLTVFHVTKSGYSSSSATPKLFFFPRDNLFGSEKSEDLEEDLDAVVFRDGVLDEAEGDEEDEALEGLLSIRLIAAGLYGAESGMLSMSSSVGSECNCAAAESESSLFPSYCSQSASTW